ncbi:hypothetical protein GCM10010168_63280 [Actinoplanes ianthinogenes]|uniref:Uncharacterized protein n=1 Tax=Actinoplanes ianthinogenes TaxID=122358 RepID=A0ABM7LJI9_9ACTN|nr:hypothetical protein [Actinoplanes ianthinogenes]BCJ39424.1 hypothetical protein Aiant_00810 [Actinoplanes ianthinogenes]GGR36204.1 hypothetical protein GCM10010168_63280 [Actinoplanes ianthinogenes]
MSIPSRLWRALGVDRNLVRLRAQFFTGFTEMEPPPYDRHAVLEVLADGGRDRDRPLDLLDRDDPAVRELWRDLTERGPRTPPDRWVPVAERADALRQAAVATLLFDLPAGRTMLRRAAREYVRLGLPFGLFLTVAATGARVGPAATALLASLLGIPASGDGAIDAVDLDPARSLLRVPEVMAVSEQQLYLLMAVVAGLSPANPDLLAAIGSAPQSTQPFPVGALAQPLSSWWETASLIARTTDRGSGTRRLLRDRLAEFARAHGRHLEIAQRDVFHWENALAGVDLVDLDLAGATALAARALRLWQLPRWDLRRDFGDLPDLAQVSLAVGLQLGGGDLAYEDDPRDPEPSPTSAVDEADQYGF